MTKFRRAFAPELKQEAVRLVTEGGRSIADVAREVGVRPEQLRTWKKQLLASGVVARPLRVESAEDELRRVKRELEVMRQERDFAKRAAAWFAKGSA
jgi:transposase